MLYSIGDLAIAYQAPEIHQTLQVIHAKTKVGAERASEEVCMIGIKPLTLAQAIEHFWTLPEDLVELFGVTSETAVAGGRADSRPIKELSSVPSGWSKP